MTTISRERIEQYVNDPRMCNVNDEIRQIARIALASLEAEPVAWECGENIILFNPDTVEAYAKRAEISPKPLFSAPPALVVPEFETWFNSQESGRSICSTQIRRSLQEISWNACRAAMLHAGNFREIPETSTNSPVTPTLLPGGFTVEDAKELHEDLVRSHISQALSGEKMKKKDRDADLRWIHGVIVQAAWFVKASLEALPEPPQEVNQ
ncbi:dTDP-6-deoxy-L-hexose 3-O-methyltransferase [Escherichia coli]|uniref:dTDP-6-deoxy-L-hexose 3-O-methyltransferase n=1 Tax=Escherichia coli TaxID=562 RepID=UPI000BB5D85C|nr:dTDP-6-deoxy-L-hexose 3-O-methyltransferase [Escherichia coli]EEQ4408617.1 dTDP-6-deoxy-L-hexose 3-O-methyltransferase [Escherichia coli]EER4382573.1 dTDP-6-deoxy-L-hexose 3-O-methyltransferase [Escherichia coli]EET1639539.1 dTDP-6-deoxy-L-hexose 3-O-methyltransferase [Escherichia coli]EEW3014627.1 dTDP-6-deoxy-L-hexose 3-O-methyltransferase [Escherichia coli]